MAVLTVQRKMHYCPKCNRTYEEGTQRFCSSDGGRLLPAPATAKPGGGGQSKGVFTNLLNRTLRRDEKDKNISAGPHFDEPEQKQTAQPSAAASAAPVSDKIFEMVKTEAPPSDASEPEEPTGKPIPRLIKPSEVPVSQAKLGDRSRDPAGRSALSWENPSILLGQLIKGRYSVVEYLSEDETSIAYLAEDKIIKGKKVVVRVLMDENAAADNASKIFAEERVSLSHINHPNVAHLLDSGELLEGKSFIVSEHVEGTPLREKLRQTGPFNQLRTARIIRQVANALSEVHENGILHRNLNPQHIVLSVSRSGIEQVKVTDFAVFDGFNEQNEETIKYLSPEQLEGRLPNYASDIYSLAVIAYQMLTGRMPFNFSAEKELLKAQKEGLRLRPTNLRLDLSPVVDEILEKALSYKPSDRYPKARDFGDTFFNALTAVAAPWEKAPVETHPKEEKFPFAVKEPLPEKPAATEKPAPPVAPVTEPGEKPAVVAREEVPAPKKREIPKKRVPKKEVLKKEVPKKEVPQKESPKIEFKLEDKKEIKAVKATGDLAWEKRSPEPLQKATAPRVFIFALGLLLLGVGTWAIWNYFSNRPAMPVYIPQTNRESAGANPGDPNKTTGNAQTESANAAQPVEPTPREIESPPLPRKIIQPPNTEYFQSSKEALKGDLAKNFRGFSFYYPNDWTKNPTTTHFVDVARIGATGTPIEQFLVYFYESKGTFTADAEKFPKLVEQSVEDLRKALDGKFTLLSQGETKINGDWRAYEMKFQGDGMTKNGDKITLWGRRLWIPAARPGVRSGFVITLLATSLSPEVKSADDIGVKGELANVLQTFEPTSLDAAY